MTRAAFALALGLTCLLAGGARAQFMIGAERQTLTGAGRMVVTGQTTADLTSATVLLMRDRKAQVSLQGRNTGFSLAGIWRKVSDGEYHVTVQSALGDRKATGTARVYFEGRRISSLDGRGTANGRSFVFSLDRNSGGGGAWDGTSLSTSATGSGTIRRDRDRPLAVDRVSVVLSRNGQAELTFRGEGIREFTGRWRRAGAVVQLTLTSGFDTARLDGTGTITLDGERIRTIRLSGTQGPARFSVEFDADRRPGGSFEGMNVTSVGRGEFTIAGQRELLREVRVWLRPGGDAEITLYGDRERRLTGTWHAQGRDTVAVNINGGLRGTTNGHATVTLRRGVTFSSVEGSGRSGDRNFDFSFRARD